MSGDQEDPVVLDDCESTNNSDEAIHEPGSSGEGNQLAAKKVDRLEDDEDEDQNMDDPDTRMSHDSDNDSADSGEYIVEAIRAKRKNPKTGTTEWYIKWKDYPEAANTWEPTENLKCPKLMQEFNEREKTKRRGRPRTTKQSDLTPQPAKRLRRGASINGHEYAVQEEEQEGDRLFLEDEDDDDEDENPKSKNRKGKQQESKETRAETLDVRGFDRGLPLDKILNACHGDDDKLYFFVTWVGRDELELVESETLEQKAPQELCRWYRKRLYWQNNSNERNGNA